VALNRYSRHSSCVFAFSQLFPHTKTPCARTSTAGASGYSFKIFVMSGSSWLSLGLFSMMGMISSEWNPSGGMPLIISMLRMRNSLENRKVIKTAFILCVWITDLDPRSLINVLSDESPKLSLIT